MMKEILKGSDNMKKTILTGLRPTGNLHLGHLFGAAVNFKKLQESGNEFFLEIADYVYQFSRYNKELFNQYRNYVNEQYNEFIL